MLKNGTGRKTVALIVAYASTGYRGNNIPRPQEYRVIEDKRRREELRKYLLERMKEEENDPYRNGMLVPDASSRFDFEDDREYYAAIEIHRWLRRNRLETLDEYQIDMERLLKVDEDDFLPEDLWKKYEQAIDKKQD